MTEKLIEEWEWNLTLDLKDLDEHTGEAGDTLEDLYFWLERVMSYLKLDISRKPENIPKILIETQGRIFEFSLSQYGKGSIQAKDVSE